MSFLIGWWAQHVVAMRPRAWLPNKPMSHLEWGACVQRGSAHPLDPAHPWMRWGRTARSIEEAWNKK